MLRRYGLVLLFVGVANSAHAEGLRDASRGEMLYATHCIACHSSQVHWRDKKLALDWKSLRAEVLRWQKLSSLGWGEDDVAAVARYLNDLYYHYPATE